MGWLPWDVDLELSCEFAFVQLTRLRRLSPLVVTKRIDRETKRIDREG